MKKRVQKQRRTPAWKNTISTFLPQQHPRILRLPSEMWLPEQELLSMLVCQADALVPFPAGAPTFCRWGWGYRTLTTQHYHTAWKAYLASPGEMPRVSVALSKVQHFEGGESVGQPRRPGCVKTLVQNRGCHSCSMVVCSPMRTDGVWVPNDTPSREIPHTMAWSQEARSPSEKTPTHTAKRLGRRSSTNLGASRGHRQGFSGQTFEGNLINLAWTPIGKHAEIRVRQKSKGCDNNETISWDVIWKISWYRPGGAGLIPTQV